MSEATVQIIQGDGLAFMRAEPAAVGSSVITSLPDASELPLLGFAGWRTWFMDAARAVLQWLPEGGFALFYQSDTRHEDAWVDKSYLVQRAAEAEDAALVWHKIVCRSVPGTSTWGRASYSHLLCFTRGAIPKLRVASPHVLPNDGDKAWTRGMGQAACELACNYLREHTTTRVIVDPFCGRGSVLAVAHRQGFDVVGVELSGKRCRAARAAISGTP